MQLQVTRGTKWLSLSIEVHFLQSMGLGVEGSTLPSCHGPGPSNFCLFSHGTALFPMSQSACPMTMSSPHKEGARTGHGQEGSPGPFLQLTSHWPKLSYKTKKCNLCSGQSCVQLEIGAGHYYETKERMDTGEKQGGGSQKVRGEGRQFVSVRSR